MGMRIAHRVRVALPARAAESSSSLKPTLRALLSPVPPRRSKTVYDAALLITTTSTQVMHAPQHESEGILHRQSKRYTTAMSAGFTAARFGAATTATKQQSRNRYWTGQEAALIDPTMVRA
eukprot:6207779-Pleurochrysis_carterae.AAC.1